MLMQLTRTALHEHLGTLAYKGPFDRVIDIARKRLGPGGVFSVASIGDDRLPSDKRYERFIDSPSTKYHKIDLDGKGVYVEEADITVLHGLEAEIMDGSVLVVGLPRDTSLRVGRHINHHSFFKQLGGDTLNFIVHPFHSGGSGPFLLNFYKSSSRKKEDEIFSKITGVEVKNGEATLPIPGYLLANRKAEEFFSVCLEDDYETIAPVQFGDGHSVYEFGRITTNIARVEVTNAIGEYDGNATIDSLRKGFKGLTLEDLRQQAPSLLARTLGVVGAIDHAADLVLWKLAVKSDFLRKRFE